MTDPITQSMMQGAAGAASGSDSPVRENMWALNMYKGDGNASTSIVNGLNMAKGGMIMSKESDGSLVAGWDIRDTENGPNLRLRGNSVNAIESNGTGFSFNSDGYNPGTANWTNNSSSSYQSVCFRKHKGFFDVVKYSGNSVSGRQIPHELETQPGMIWVKQITTATNWCCWHENLGHGTGNNSGHYSLELNDKGDETAAANRWNNTVPTSTHFTVGNDNLTNETGNEYVAYLWADGHSDTGSAIFGPNEDQTLCKTGMYNGNSSTQFIDSIGFAPEFIIVKSFQGYGGDYGGQWGFLNTQLGFGYPDGGGNGWIIDGRGLQINSPNVMSSYFRIYPRPSASISAGTGGLQFYSESWWNQNNGKFLYIAFKGPSAKVSATADFGAATGEDYLQIDAAGDSNANCPPGCFVSSNTKRSFPPDFTMRKEEGGTSNYWCSSRETRDWLWTTADYSAPVRNSSYASFLSSTGHGKSVNSNWMSWMFRGGPGFYHRFYQGASGQPQYHGLGVVPEMVWCKKLDAGDQVSVGHKGFDDGSSNAWEYYMDMNSTNAAAQSTNVFQSVNAERVQLGGWNGINSSPLFYSMLCFASVAGISKVDSYTGDGTTSNSITTGFQPRFLIIKCWSNGGTNWTMWDSVRGWDKKLELNSEQQEVTAAWVSVSTTGFTLTNTHPEVNTNGYKYIYYAHA